jgi:hypothetical protein
MGSDLTRGERLQIMLSPEEFAAIDEWRFQKRMPSRASAVRELLKRGLAAEGFGIAALGSKSRDFGVTVNQQTRRPRNERHLNND